MYNVVFRKVLNPVPTSSVDAYQVVANYLIHKN